MKKAVSVLLVSAFFLISALSITAEDVAVLSLSTDTSSINAGETVNVVCTLTKPESLVLGGFEINIGFDKTRLELMSCKFADIEGFSAGRGAIAKANTNGYYRFLFIYPTETVKEKVGDEMVDKEVIINPVFGDFLTLTFKAKEDCYSGKVTINPIKMAFGDENAKTVKVSKSSAIINIEGKTPPASSNTSSSSETSSDGSTSSSISNPASNNSSGTDLKEIIVDGSSGVIKLEEGKTDYTINVGKDKKSIDFSAITKDDDSTVTVEGGENLKEGENNVKITVTDKDGNTKDYNIKVIKGKDNSVNIYIFIIPAALIIATALITGFYIFRKRRTKFQ